MSEILVDGKELHGTDFRDFNPTRKATDRNPEGGRIGFQTTVTLYICGRCEAVGWGQNAWKKVKHWGWLCDLCHTEV